MRSNTFAITRQPPAMHREGLPGLVCTDRNLRCGALQSKPAKPVDRLPLPAGTDFRLNTLSGIST
jgi:hypothetical protein